MDEAAFFAQLAKYRVVRRRTDVLAPVAASSGAGASGGFAALLGGPSSSTARPSSSSSPSSSPVVAPAGSVGTAATGKAPASTAVPGDFWSTASDFLSLNLTPGDAKLVRTRLEKANFSYLHSLNLEELEALARSTEATLAR